MRIGRAYWYDVHRVGTTVRKTSIGEDGPELIDRLQRTLTIARDRQARNRKRTELVRTLHAAGMLGTDASISSLLATMERLGAFRIGGTLVGTQAFRLYAGELGRRDPT